MNKGIGVEARSQQASLAGSEGETLAAEPSPSSSRVAAAPRARPPPAVHLIAGGLGGMCGAIVTAPFDLVKTRLQSSLFHDQTVAGPGATASRSGVRALLWNFVETGHILRDVYRNEGPTALFKGLGPTLVGVMPGRSINFFCYGNGKRIYADRFNNGQENALIHLSAAATAGVITAAVTNPIWVTKTRLQLLQQAKVAPPSSTSRITPQSGPRSPPTAVPSRSFSHSYRPLSSPPAQLAHPPRPPTAYSITLAIYRTEGLAGFYRGLSASLLGVTEGVIQWGLYEQFKILAKKATPPTSDGSVAEGEGWRVSVAAGGAKLIATMITYPHEVIRTRLRQPALAGQQAKYHGLAQSFRLILREEGPRALYGGLSPHLLRVIPNAITMFYVYEYLCSVGARWDSSKRPLSRAD